MTETLDNDTLNTKTESKRDIYEHGTDTKINYDAIITEMSVVSLSKSHPWRYYNLSSFQFNIFQLQVNVIILIMSILPQSIPVPPEDSRTSFEDWVTSRMHNAS